MEPLSLIANSGIQFYKTELVIDPNADVIRSIAFHEWLDTKSFTTVLEFARYLPDYDMYVKERDLATEGFIDDYGKLMMDGLNPATLRKLDEDTEVLTVNNIENALELFEGKWMPLPYFESNGANVVRMGPIDWCRCMLVPLGHEKRRKRYKLVLAFDTKCSKDRFDSSSPFDSFDTLRYDLCADQGFILNFTQPDYGCAWVEQYLVDITYGSRSLAPKDFPSMKYVANYIYFVKYLAATGAFPSIQLYPSQDQHINIDMVLDIGNANTCGVLFEPPHDRGSFEFSSVKALEMQDLSRPEKDYREPFSMRLAFHKANFGNMGNSQHEKFRWPSFVRVGKEAKRLIYRANNRFSFEGKEPLTNHSSPKRYLWDGDKADFQWEFIQLDPVDAFNNMINLEGISNQFGPDGSFRPGEDPGTTNQFSRKSLMTFVFIEILTQAVRQINSIEFRREHGNSAMPRRLRRLLITCPTAMTQAEQLALRQCAEEASIALSRFYAGTDKIPYDEAGDRARVEILPSPKDLKKNLSLIDTRKDWIYDEATCCQLVFMYAEVSKRYLNNCKRYFDLYGRRRRDLGDYDKKAVTVASIDIGAGTTDLMICAYKYEEAATAVLTPVPLYWESFNYAGDDMLKAIIQQVLLEGQLDDERWRGCVGVVENHAREHGIANIKERLNTFFGQDTNAINFEGRQMRRLFNTQISVPIAERYLAHAQKGLPDEVLTFQDLFNEYKPSEALLDYFVKHFGFRFEDIRWRLSTARVNNIVERTFEPLIRQLCTLIHVKTCDFVLLAGRPTSLSKISELFLRYYPVSPDRLISLNDYRVGRWYPFQDGNGYFSDQKSIVAVGACVGMMGGKLDRLSGFRLNTERLKRDLISTAEYIGIHDGNTGGLSEIVISPDDNRCKLQIASLPTSLGFKRLPAKTYPARLIYALDFDDKHIMAMMKEKHGGMSEVMLGIEAELYKSSLKNRMPFRFEVIREYRESREALTIEAVEDKNRDPLSKKLFKMRLKTLDEDQGYWLDTGAFLLQIAPK